jgi:hypothetical protein
VVRQARATEAEGVVEVIGAGEILFCDKDLDCCCPLAIWFS